MTVRPGAVAGAVRRRAGVARAPEAYGGAGLGLTELCRVLVEVGRTVAPLPLAVHGPAALLLAELGTDAQRERWLPGAADRRTPGHGRGGRGARPRPRPARPWATRGRRPAVRHQGAVRAGTAADLFLVTASDRRRRGRLRRRAGRRPASRSSSSGSATATGSRGSSSTGPPATRPRRDGAAPSRLGQLLTVCGAAEQLGVTEGALPLTASYAETREQFGRPIGTFQAVSQRLADGFIDVLAQRLTLWSAVWRLGEGLPADVEVATAKLWAADAGHRLAHTTVHVHGGVGIDLDGEAHRYFTSAKRFEFAFGGATEQALTIGRALAAEPA